MMMQSFVDEKYRIEPSSDRMALHLGHELIDVNASDLYSSAVTVGTMQLLPSGKVIVLMADHQTTGGYPRIGHIVSAHLPLLAQLSPGEMFTLNKVSMTEAEKMLISMRKEIRIITRAIMEKLNRVYAKR
jgi:antagonist of KipI